MTIDNNDPRLEAVTKFLADYLDMDYPIGDLLLERIDKVDPRRNKTISMNADLTDAPDVKRDLIMYLAKNVMLSTPKRPILELDSEGAICLDVNQLADVVLEWIKTSDHE